MPTPEKITLFTSPSTNIRADLPPARTPYRQVVGLQIARRVLWLAEYRQLHPEPCEDASVALSTYNTTDVFARRLAQYVQADGSVGAARDSLQFGVWMARGIAFSSDHKASRFAVDETESCTPPAADARPGGLWVIGELESTSTTVVRGGAIKIDEADTCLHVLSPGGGLAITSLDEAVQYHEAAVPREASATPAAADPGNGSAVRCSVSLFLQPDYKTE